MFPEQSIPAHGNGARQAFPGQHGVFSSPQMVHSSSSVKRGEDLQYAPLSLMPHKSFSAIPGQLHQMICVTSFLFQPIYRSSQTDNHYFIIIEHDVRIKVSQRVLN